MNFREAAWITSMTKDNPYRTAPPGYLRSDEPFQDPIDQEPDERDILPEIEE